MDEHKSTIAKLVAQALSCPEAQALAWIETPKEAKLGDYALPCFQLAKERRQSPVAIATELAGSLAPLARGAGFESVRAVGPYVNFTLDRGAFVGSTLQAILGEGDRYGDSDLGAGKTVVVDFSSPNIAKPFGIHHLRSTLGVEKWFSDQLLSVNLELTNSLFGTLYTPHWLRRLGANIGPNTEIATIATTITAGTK